MNAPFYTRNYIKILFTLLKRGAVLLFSLLFFSASWGYEVKFEGIENEEALQLIQNISKLEKLKDSPPATLNGLKRRAEGDLPIIIQALHSFAYYNAEANFTISKDQEDVIIKIDPGPIYPFAQFTIRYFENGKEIPESSLQKPISLDELNVHINDPALPETILSAEDTLLDLLNLQGYAFAKINHRDVFADLQAKNVIVLMDVELGPLTKLGPVRIHGLERIHEDFFFKKMKWKEGDLYHPKTIEKTQEALELSGLFRSITITHAEEPVDGNIMPLDITVIEAKQRTIGFGLNFTTELGPGITAEWEDRNILGQGEKISIRTDLWKDLQDGRISYTIPDFKCQDQNLIWVLDGHHQHTKSFTETAVSLSGTIEKKINEKLRISYGGMFKVLRSMRSAFNGTFDLIKTPLQLRWSNTDSLLDPTKGETVQIKLIPSLQIHDHPFAYSINTFTGTYYQPLTVDKKFIFAAKFTLGSIIGASKHDIPPPERFYAGSENSIRGYRFLTVSPIGPHDKPLGGRSLLLYTLEIRARFKENFGLVFFYDIGNVYKNYYPDFKKGLLQSTGLGLRYYTPIGPIRLDLAFPLNRRKKRDGHRGYIDNALEAYFSIGQSF